MQSKRMSALEVISSTIFGFAIAILTQLLVFPWFGIHVHIRDHLLMGLLFTVVSIIRGYVFRRLFNYLGRTTPCPSSLSSSPAATPYFPWELRS